METKNDTLKSNLEEMTSARHQMQQLINNFFMTGGYENQINLISAAIYDIVEKGAGETDLSLDNEFAYTNRYIRESVYELTELQRFIVSLYSSFSHYKKCSDRLQHIPQKHCKTLYINKKVE